MKFRLLAPLAVLTFLQAACGSGKSNLARILEHEVGNPGNPLDLLFDDARDNAAQMLLALGDLPADLNPAVKTFLEKNARALAIDILDDVRTKHEFTNDVLPDCARTNVPPDLNKILFSRPTCAGLVTDLDMATRILIHESVHHFPADLAYPDGPRQTNEQFCNDVANHVYSLWRRAQDRGTPHWEGGPTLVNAPAARSQHTAVWTGDRMLVFGGCVASDTSLVDCGVYMKTGASFDPKADVNAAWTRLPQPPIDERALHSAVWTGSEMLVWGGCRGIGDACDVSMNDGAAYAAQNNSWHKIPVSVETPSPRVYQSAVWTGYEMIIWGGQENHKRSDAPARTVSTGGAFNPATGTWRQLSPVDAPNPRQQHTAVWTGHYMVVFGGCDREVAYHCQTYFADGKRYEPATDKWLPMSLDNAPDPRRMHTAVWTGTRMLVWGGQYRQEYLENGGSYDPETDKWTPMTSIAPRGRAGHIAVWTGKKMLVWGGVTGVEQYASGVGEYWPDALDRGNDRWDVFDLARRPTPARDLAGVWAGDAMIVWGGETTDNTFLNRGGAFFSR